MERNRILIIIEFTHTDLPAPVVPAIRIWGISAISQITTSPEMFLPKAEANLLSHLRNTSLSIISLIKTVSFSLLGTSIPTAALLGIGASIRTPTVARLREISSTSPVILEILTPGAGCNSYLVTEGPLTASRNFVDTPKLFRVFTRVVALCSISMLAFSSETFLFTSFKSRTLGKMYSSAEIGADCSAA